MTTGPYERLRASGVVSENAPLAVAVSGGSDSVALLHLTCPAFADVCAVTVDHGLRDTAAAEIALVARLCEKLGIAHHIIPLAGLTEGPNLQARARRARYNALDDWAAGHGISQIAIGHTRDDVAETFMLRLARGSGLDGLAAMQGSWQSGGITYVRPLLDMSRQALRDGLIAQNIPWADDPSNADPRFDRVRMRQALAGLEIDPVRIADAASHLRDAKTVVDDAVSEVYQASVQIDAGDAVIDLGLLNTARETVVHRMVSLLVRWIGNAAYPPRYDDMRRALAADGKRTLHGVIWHTQGEMLRLSREYAATAPVDGPLWDGRWTFSTYQNGQTVQALGGRGLAQCPAWRDTGRSHAQLLATPSLWDGDTLIAAPYANLGKCDTLDLCLPQGFRHSDVELP